MDFISMGVNVNHGVQRDESPELEVGDANENCPQNLKKMPLKIYQNTPFQAINSFFSGEGA